jgi:hypothetical protein
MRGYTAFLVCGLCVALNVLAYIPSQTFEQAETTEFTVTLALVVTFLISSITALILTVKNCRDVGLLALLVASIAFVALSYYGGSFQLHVRRIVDLSYVVGVLGVTTVRLLMLRRSTE